LSFASPIWLATLLLVPAGLAAYLLSRRRARRYAVRYPAAPTLLMAAAAVPPWRRHLPAALVLTALASMSMALAKPHLAGRVAVDRASIMLVTDHSGSMQATDVEPTRLAAAQRAAHTFIDELPGAISVGAVAYAAQPDAVEAPSTDHDVARAVIDGQNADGATATGDALQLAIDLLRHNGKRSPSAIVLLSDGTTTTGRDPLIAAQRARREHVPIYTVALGTSDATVPNPQPNGPPLLAAPDPATLHRISTISHARAFKAADSTRLQSIYKSLGSQLGSRPRNREITVAFAVVGLALLLGAGATSVRWTGRLP
jgi:Ca-activated chloride channel family protein